MNLTLKGEEKLEASASDRPVCGRKNSLLLQTFLYIVRIDLLTYCILMCSRLKVICWRGGKKQQGVPAEKQIIGPGNGVLASSLQ